MLYEIYETIVTLQNRLGNNAKVEFSASGGFLTLRIDWAENNIHAQHVFSYDELRQMKSENAFLNLLVIRYGGARVLRFRENHVAP